MSECTGTRFRLPAWLVGPAAYCDWCLAPIRGGGIVCEHECGEVATGCTPEHAELAAITEFNDRRRRELGEKVARRLSEGGTQ